jgi:hypothetical protein
MKRFKDSKFKELLIHADQVKCLKGIIFITEGDKQCDYFDSYDFSYS